MGCNPAEGAYFIDCNGFLEKNEWSIFLEEILVGVFGLLKRNLVLVAIVIGLIFLFWPIPNVSRSGKNMAVKTQIQLLEEGIFRFRQDTGKFPSTSEGLSALRTQPPDTPQWKGSYLPKDVPPDAWGNEYVYLHPPHYGNKEFDLYSFGANGVESAA